MQRTVNQTTVVLLTAGCFLAFFVFGFTDSLKGPTVPAVLAELKIGYGTGGNIFLGQSLGFLIATLVTGILADRFGLKAVTLMAGFMILLGVAAYSTLASPPGLAAAFFTLGLGFGALELGTNAIIVSLHPLRKGLFLNLMHLLYGMGAMIAPLWAGALLAGGIYWRTIYRWDLLSVAALLAYFLFMRFPPAKEETIGQIQLQEVPRFAFRGRLPWFYLAISLYVAVEVGMGTWLVTFLQQAQGVSITTSSRALSVFFGTLMLGRFIGGFIVHRVGYLRSVLLFSLGAVACIALGLYGPPVLHNLLPVTGFFFSITFPTLTAAVSDAHPENGNTILGVLFAFAGLGGLAGPWLVAWGSDLFGLKAGFGINLLLAAMMLLSIVMLMKGKTYESEAA